MENYIQINIGKLTGLDIDGHSKPNLCCLVYCTAWDNQYQKTNVFENTLTTNFDTLFMIPIIDINEDIIDIEIIDDSNEQKKLSSISIEAKNIPFGKSIKKFSLTAEVGIKDGGKIDIYFQKNHENSNAFIDVNKKKRKRKKTNQDDEKLPLLLKENESENSSLDKELALKNKKNTCFDELLHILCFLLFIYIYIHLYIYLKLNQMQILQNGLEFSSYFEYSELFDPKILIVSAYFPFARSKYSQSEYNYWIKSFLQVVNCKTIIYTTPVFYDNYYKEEIKNIPLNRYRQFIFNLTFKDIYEVPCVKNLSSVFKHMHDLDREKGLHNSDLYAVWNSKLYFIHEATLIYPDYSLYFWLDSGVVRDPTYNRLYDKNGKMCDQSEFSQLKCHHLSFPSPDFTNTILSRYSNPPLDICLFFVSYYAFPKHTTQKIENDISQGCFFGSKIGIQKFYDAYWEVTNSWIKNDIFCGKEQDTFNFIFSNYYDKINFYVFPAFSSFNYNQLGRFARLRFRWFVFISAFSKENPYNVANKLLPSNQFFK